MKFALLLAMLLVATAAGCNSEPDLTGDWYGNWFGHWHDPDHAAETPAPAASIFDTPASELNLTVGDRQTFAVTGSGWPGRLGVSLGQLPTLDSVEKRRPPPTTNPFSGKSAIAYREARRSLLNRDFVGANAALDRVIVRTLPQRSERQRLRYLTSQAAAFWNEYQRAIPNIQPGDLLHSGQGFMVVQKRSETILWLRHEDQVVTLEHDWKSAPVTLAAAVVRPWLAGQGAAADKVLAAVWAVDSHLSPHHAALHALQLESHGMPADAVFAEIGL